MRMHWVLGVAAALAACKQDAGPGLAPAVPAVDAVAAVDALWQLAPPWAAIGAVASGDALGLAARGLERADELARGVPMAGAVSGAIGRVRGWLAGTAADPVGGGIALERGAAWFSDGKDRIVAVLPVADRARFAAAHGGAADGELDRYGDRVCRMIGARYVCATAAADLALGGGALGAAAGIRGTRGDAELVIDPAKLPPIPSSSFLRIDGPIRAVMTLRRGELVLRVDLPGALRGPGLDQLASLPRAAIDVDHTAGFVVLPIHAAAGVVPPTTVAPGVTAADVLRSLAGPLQLVVPAGQQDTAIEARLRDVAPLQAMLAQCADRNRVGPVPLTANPDGSCTAGPLPALANRHVTVWLDGTTLRAGVERRAIAAGTAVAPSAAGRELAAYGLALWGRGVIAGDLPLVGALDLDAARTAFGELSELGLGLDVTADHLSFLLVGRTIHANPPAVVAELERLAAAKQLGGTELAAIAARNPAAPIAADVAVGNGGIMMPIAALGILSAVAIPAFIEYLDRGKATEADLMLNRIAKTSKIHFTARGGFAVGTAPRTPATSSCAAADRIHHGSAALWSDPVWRALDVAILDDFRHQYAYTGTATEFTATAYSDLDCDGIELQLVAHGTVDAAGAPTVTFERRGGPD